MILLLLCSGPNVPLGDIAHLKCAESRSTRRRQHAIFPILVEDTKTAGHWEPDARLISHVPLPTTHHGQGGNIPVPEVEVCTKEDFAENTTCEAFTWQLGLQWDSYNNIFNIGVLPHLMQTSNDNHGKIGTILESDTQKPLSHGILGSRYPLSQFVMSTPEF